MGFTKTETNKAKGIAILLLLYHHLFMSARTIREYQLTGLFSVSMTTKIANAARVCVWIFVFLSAYGLSVSFEKNKENSSHWIFARWFSLMKQYWFIWLLWMPFTLLMGGSLTTVYQNNLWYVFLDAMAWSDFMGTPLLVGAFWYMCLAQIIVILFPAFYGVCRKFSWAAIPAGLILLPFIGAGIRSDNGGNYTSYLFAVLLGILFFQNHVFEKIQVNGIGKKFLLAIILLVGTAAFLEIKWYYAVHSGIDSKGISSLACAAAATLICMWAYCCMPGYTGKLFEVLGRYSAVIFLIHMFFVRYFKPFLYMSGNIEVSFLMLVGVSLAAAVLIELFRKLIRYDKGMNYILQYIIKK